MRLLWLVPPLAVRPNLQLLARLAIEQSRHKEPIGGLEGPYSGLRLGVIDAIDRARVKPEVAQMHLRHLDISSGEEEIHRGLYRPGLVFPWVRRDAGGEQHQWEPADDASDTSGTSHTIPPVLPHPAAHIRLTMLPMGFPILRVLCGQGWVTDDQQIFRILLLGRLGEVK